MDNTKNTANNYSYVVFYIRNNAIVKVFFFFFQAISLILHFVLKNSEEEWVLFKYEGICQNKYVVACSSILLAIIFRRRLTKYTARGYT